MNAGGSVLLGQTEKVPAPIGLHRFYAFEGDLEFGLDERTGLDVVKNPLVWRRQYRNVITTAGKTAYLQRLGASSVAAFTALGVGTDSTAATAAQTQLNPSVTGSVLLQTVDGGYPTVASTTETWQATFGTAVANFQWNEAALFNGTTNGTAVMFNRVIIGPFTKSSATSIIYVATITQG